MPSSQAHRYHEVEMAATPTTLSNTATSSLNSNTSQEDEAEGIFLDPSSSSNNKSSSIGRTALCLSVLLFMWITSLLIMAYWVRQFTLSQMMPSNETHLQPCNCSVVANVGDSSQQQHPPQNSPVPVPPPSVTDHDAPITSIIPVVQSAPTPPTFSNKPTPGFIPQSTFQCLNCCQGSEACTYNLGTIGDNACNGGKSCQYNEGHIEVGACNAAYSCQKNQGYIGNHACCALYACSDQAPLSVIGNGSCTTIYACIGNQGRIGNQSCLATLGLDCATPSSQLSKCEEERYACSNNNGTIGNGACYNGMAHNCYNNEGTIADGYDITTTPEWQAQENVKIQSTKHVQCQNCCRGDSACEGNTGQVGDGSCNGDYACRSNTGVIGNHSCTESHACLGNTGSVGDGACTADNACVGNAGGIGNGACTGPSNVCTENGISTTIPDDTCSNEDHSDPLCGTP